MKNSVFSCSNSNVHTIVDACFLLVLSQPFSFPLFTAATAIAAAFSRTPERRQQLSVGHVLHFKQFAQLHIQHDKQFNNLCIVVQPVNRTFLCVYVNNRCLGLCLLACQRNWEWRRNSICFMDFFVATLSFCRFSARIQKCVLYLWEDG